MTDGVSDERDVSRETGARDAGDVEPGTGQRAFTRRTFLTAAAAAAAVGAVGFGAGRFTAPGAVLPDWTTADIPDLSGRRAIVTGGNGYPQEGRSGIGYHEAFALAAAGADVVIASRNQARGEEAVRRMRAEIPGATVRFDVLDLTDLSSVAAFAGRVEDHGNTLDLLVNNAGVQGRAEREVTPDGFERVFATNALGPFALSGRLLPLLRRSTDPRIVWTASARVGQIDFDDLQKERTYDYAAAYDDTKLGQLLMAFEAERLSRQGGWGLRSMASHPGVARTNIVLDGPGPDSPEGWRFRWVRPMWQDPAIGALPALYAATSPLASGGAYYGPRELQGLRGLPGFAVIPEQARDTDLATRYWETLEELSGVSFR